MSAATHEARCRVTGKRRFATHALAMAELAHCTEQRRREGKVYRMERGVYLCDHCDDWHLTSRPREEFFDPVDDWRDAAPRDRGRRSAPRAGRRRRR